MSDNPYRATDNPYQGVSHGRAIFVASQIGEDLLAAAYLQMTQEKLLDLMFWQKTPTLREFLNWACSRPDVVVIGAFVNGALAGLGWVREITERGGKRFADVGEVFFREYQAMGVTRDLAKLMLDFAFEQVGVHALHGITPAKNIAALRFMKQMGFEWTCEIPDLCMLHGELCPGVISWITRERWQEKKPISREGVAA